METDNPVVSIVMPVYNEENYISQCIESLLKQDFPTEKMEWIFVDGCSKDNTVEKLKSYQQLYSGLIRILSNPHKTVPYAMNIGIAEAKGTYLIRLDAHAEYASDYISKCVYYLGATGADNVGGVVETKSRGFVGQTIAKVLSSKFGVGNSQFRTNGNSGYVDTVPFGAFRREIFDRVGLYDERLTRNQDNEMNYRIRKNGGKIYLSRDIHLSYYCRDSVRGIVDMAKKNGMWNIITMKLCPGSMGIRHFVPLLFVISVICLLMLGIIWDAAHLLLCAEILLYLCLDFIFSMKSAQSLKQLALLMFLFPAFHCSYGFGSLVGVIRIAKREF